MLGFMLFMMTLVLGVLGLVAGLRALGVIGGEDTLPPGGVTARDLERVHDALAALESRLDRLQEQHEFVERLLADRETPGRLAPGPGEPGGGGAGAPEPAAETDSVLFDTREEG